MGVRLLPLLLLVASAGAAPDRAHGDDAGGASYVFAVVPQAPPEVMSRLWSPIVERIARDAGVTLRLKLYEGVEAFQTDLAAGGVDFAYANPVQAIRAYQAARYRPLVRNEKAVRGVFFVARHSPFTSVASLAGKEVAFIGPWTFCSASLRHEVQRLGVVPRYVGTAANAYKSVLLGLTAAGGTLDYVLEDAPPDVQEKLRVVFSTPPMASHAVVVHPRVPPEVARGIASALRALAGTAQGAELLQRVHLEAPVAADYPRDYAPLERLLDDPAAARPAGRGG